MFAKTRISASGPLSDDRSREARGARAGRRGENDFRTSPPNSAASDSAARLGHRFAGVSVRTPGPAIQRQDDDPLDAGLPPNINPFGDTDPAPADPFGTTDLPPGGAIDPLNPMFPKPPGLPNIPEPPPGGFPNPPPTPASPGGGAAPEGGGILDTIGSVLGAIGGTLFDIFPPVPKFILHPEGSDQEA